MVKSHTAWLPFGPSGEHPPQVASAARVQPLGNPGGRRRRLGLHLTRQAHLVRITFPPTRQNLPNGILTSVPGCVTFIRLGCRLQHRVVARQNP